MQPQAPTHLIGKLFRFKGQTTTFRVVSAYLAAGFIPAVLGHSAEFRRPSRLALPRRGGRSFLLFRRPFGFAPDRRVAKINRPTA
jgi:hypothetical protein